MYGGYCYFNNAAIAAQAITERTGERVAILDVDYHHGNGTQQIFWRRGDVLYVSLHAAPDRQYPYFLGWRRRDRRGRRAPGRTSTCRCRPGLTTRATSPRSTAASSAIAGRRRVRSSSSRSGFDTYGHDPIGDFALTTAVYHEVGRRVAALGRRLVILQEGGYHRPSLGDERPGVAARRGGPAVRPAAGRRRSAGRHARLSVRIDALPRRTIAPPMAEPPDRRPARTTSASWSTRSRPRSARTPATGDADRGRRRAPDDNGRVEAAVREILIEIGEDPDRQGLVGTPDRVHRMYAELTAGYHVDPERLINGAIFDVDYREMVVVKDIPFYSLCEHHLLPFFGTAAVAYIPRGRVIGLSKIPRIVEMYARRLQVQERLTQQIADFLQERLDPQGVGVVIEATHLCAVMRGVRKPGHGHDHVGGAGPVPDARPDPRRVLRPPRTAGAGRVTAAASTPSA